MIPEGGEDELLCAAAEQLLQQSLEVPKYRLSVSVFERKLRVKGIVKWHYQKAAALKALQPLTNPGELCDEITVDHTLTEELDKSLIWEAVSRSAIPTNDLDIVVAGTDVMLVGAVPTEAYRQRIEHVIKALPGVKSVRNALHIM